jgi:hypothetical protein
MPMATKRASKRSEPENKKIEHGPELDQNRVRIWQYVTDSTVGQSFGERQRHPADVAGRGQDGSAGRTWRGSDSSGSVCIITTPDLVGHWSRARDENRLERRWPCWI